MPKQQFIPSDKSRKVFQGMREPTGFDASNRALNGDISFDNGNRRLSIAVQGGESYYNFWINGREFRKTATETYDITDDEGEHWIYYDADGVLQELVNPSTQNIDTILRTLPLVAYVRWDTTNNEAVWFNDERHLNQMDGNTHSNLHFTRGTQYAGGGALGTFDIGDITNDSGAQFSVEAISILDEDLQFLSDAVGSTTGLEILYKTGASGDWRRITETGFSVLTDTTAGLPAPTGRLVWNEFTGGAWQLTTVADNRYVLCHVISTSGNDSSERLFAIVGQNQYLTLNLAQAGAVNEKSELITAGLAGPEFIFVGTVIFQTKSSYGNSVKATVRQTAEGENYVNWLLTTSQPGSAPGDHANLTGLENDNHPGHPWLEGRSGGQILYGGIDANDDLTLEGTSHATKDTSYVILQPSGGNVGIGTSAPIELLHIYAGGGAISGATVAPGMVIQNSANAADNVEAYMVAGSEGTSTLGFGCEADALEASIGYNCLTNDMTLKAPDSIIFETIELFATSASSNKPRFRLINTNADASGPIWSGYNDSASPADEDILAEMRGSGNSSASGTEQDYAYTIYRSKDVTTGDESGSVEHWVRFNGTLCEMVTISGYKGVVGQGEIILNEDGVDVDFRVESDSNAHALFMDAGNSRVGINVSSPNEDLEVEGKIRTNSVFNVNGVDGIPASFSIKDANGITHNQVFVGGILTEYGISV